MKIEETRSLVNKEDAATTKTEGKRRKSVEFSKRSIMSTVCVCARELLSRWIDGLDLPNGSVPLSSRSGEREREGA